MLNQELISLSKLIKPYYIIHSITCLVEWDQETHMPKNGLELRTEQLEYLKLLEHKLFKKSSFRNILSKLIDLSPSIQTIYINNLSSEEEALLTELRADYLRATLLSTSIIKSISAATSRGLERWREAREQDNYSIYNSAFKEILHHTMRKAKAYRKTDTDHPYNSLLNLYEPDMTVEILNPIFAELKSTLPPLLQAIQSKQTSIDPTICTDSPLEISRQIDLSHEIISLMGLPKESYNFTQSSHPFCSALSTQDIRMTSHFDSNNILKGLFATMHETGHGLYEHQLPKKWTHTPLAQAASLGLHESQSRFWEVYIGKSLEFWKFFYPRLQKALPNKYSSISVETFHSSLNYIQPSKIRIYADEVTYNLHITIRYEIEKELLEKSLSPQKIKGHFHELMEKYLGIKVENDADGILQDIHWSLGHFGYFPTYTIGNLYGAMIFKAFKQENPDWGERLLEDQNAHFIRDWLKTKIHSKGKTLPPHRLVEEVCQSNFSCTSFFDYIKEKYKINRNINA